MPALRNAKWERFAQNVSNGMTQGDAYTEAGYESNANAAAVSAGRLLKNAQVAARIEELLERRQQIEIKATEKAVNRLAIDKERILSELAKIGFADIRKAVKWGYRELGPSDSNPDQMTFANDVALMPSGEIDEATAGAIAEISETASGVKIKFHDKRAALVDMGKHLGLFKEVHEHSGPGGGPIPVSRIERVVVDPAHTDAEGVPAAPATQEVSRSQGRTRGS